MTDIDFKTQLADRLKKRSSGENYQPPVTSAPNTPTKGGPQPPPPRASVIVSPSFLSPPQSPRSQHRDTNNSTNSSSSSSASTNPNSTSPLLKPPIPDRKNLNSQKSSSLGALPTPPKINNFTPPPPPPSSVSMNSLSMPPPPPVIPQREPSSNNINNYSTPPPPIAPREPSSNNLNSFNNPPNPVSSPQYRKSPPQVRHQLNHPPQPLTPQQLPLPPPPQLPTSSTSPQYVSKVPSSTPQQLPPPPPVSSPTLPPITISSPTLAPISNPPPPQGLVVPNRQRQSVYHTRSSSLDPKMMAQITGTANNMNQQHSSLGGQSQPIPKRLSTDLQHQQQPTMYTQQTQPKRLSGDVLKLNNMINNRLSGGLSPPIAKPFFDDKILKDNSKANELKDRRDQEEVERKERDQKKKEKKEQDKKDQEKRDQEKKEKKEQEKKEKKEKQEKEKKEKKDKKLSSSTGMPMAGSSSNCTTIFNNTLDQVMETQRERLAGQYSDLSIPAILKILTESIVQMDGCSTEGIFRVPGTSSEIIRIKQRINEWDFSLDTTDVHVLAGLLKLWLRELTDPIIPSSLYDDCIKSWNSKNDSLKILNSLPSLNRDVLFFILNFLKTVSNPIYFSKSKMDIDNVAMVFAPGLLRCPSSDPNSLLLNSQYEKDFIKNLIEIV